MTSYLVSILIIVLTAIMAALPLFFDVVEKYDVMFQRPFINRITKPGWTVIGIGLTIIGLSIWKISLENQERVKDTEAIVNRLGNKFDSSLSKYNLRYNKETQTIYKPVDTSTAIIGAKISNAIQDREQAEIDQALKNVNSTNDNVAISGSDFLFSYYKRKEFAGFKLTENQMQNLNRVFVNRPSTYMTSALLPVLLYKPNPYATAFCKKMFRGEVMLAGDNPYGAIVAPYLDKVGATQFIPSFVSGIKKNQENAQTILLPVLQSISKENLSILLNSNSLVDAINKNPNLSLVANLQSLISDKKEVLNNSLFYKKGL